MTYDPKLSHFDIDMARGAQGELLVLDICKMLAAGNGNIEVKRDAWFVHSQRFYVERECQGRDGVWRKSGIDVTKAKLWAFVMGAHPGIAIFETAWLRRAMELAAKDERNRKAECAYGKNPTRGIYVYISHLIKTREPSLDEHRGFR